MKYLKYFLLSLAIIALDQAVKLVVHRNMYLGEEFPVIGDWFKIHYTRNPGMAFGIELDWKYGKLVLSVFRLLAMVGIGFYLYQLAKKAVPQGLLWCTALILGGAVGNVIDSTFYGVLFNLATENAPTRWFHGEVVDMFYLDIWKGYLPQWLPGMGGEYYSLWPIFNIADASIFVGVAVILVMQRKYFAHRDLENAVPNENAVPENDSAGAQTEAATGFKPDEPHVTDAQGPQLGNDRQPTQIP